MSWHGVRLAGSWHLLGPVRRQTGPTGKLYRHDKLGLVGEDKERFYEPVQLSPRLTKGILILMANDTAVPVPAPQPGTGNLYRLVEAKLAEKSYPALDEYIRSQRNNGVAYRVIAISLTRDTGVDVTHEAVRRWHHALQTRDRTAA